MPYKRYHKPNRSLPRRFTPEDVARLFCRLVEDGWPEEYLDQVIDSECGEERRRRAQERQRARATAAEGLDQAPDIEQFYQDLLRRMQGQLLDTNDYLNLEITIIKRQQTLLKLLSPVVTILRRAILTAPVATLMRTLERQNNATLQRIEPLKAANDEIYKIVEQFIANRQLAQALAA